MGRNLERFSGIGGMDGRGMSVVEFSAEIVEKRFMVNSVLFFEAYS